MARVGLEEEKEMLKLVSSILDRATSIQGVVGANGAKHVATFDKDAELLYGMATYPIRRIDEGGLLTARLTTQPVLFVRHEGRISPLAYAEDVVNHPLRDTLTGLLASISFRST